MSADNGPKKRKRTAADHSVASKKPRADGRSALIEPHEAILKELSSNHNVLPLSVISSTQIRKRVADATSHLLDVSSESHLVLLYARTAEVCKMVTVVEQCKRTLGEQGRTWYQYNQLFDLPAGAKKKNAVEEPAPEKEAGGGSDSDEDAFETMENRFEQAVLPPPQARIYKSLRIFLSSRALPELRSRDDVTVQSSEGTTLY